MEMKTVYADRSDSESDDEDGYSQNFEVVDYPEVKKSASSKVKSLFKKSKKWNYFLPSQLYCILENKSFTLATWFVIILTGCFKTSDFL